MSTPRRRLRLAFCDFWDEGAPTNWIRDLIARRYDIEISERPEFVVYSVFGRRFLAYDCPRICYIGEPRSPNFFECDYALSFDWPQVSRGGRGYRLPHYALYADPAALVRGPGFDPAAVLAQKTRFCNFVYSRSGRLPGHQRRIRFFEKLSRYKRVDAGGRILNNVGGPVADKLAFIRDYKFTIAFENTSKPGYVTEKIFEPFLARSLPIYWGHPLVERDFNPRSFVDCGRFRRLDDVVDYVVALDRDDRLYLEHMREPPLRDDRPDEAIRPDGVLGWLDRVFACPEPVRGRSPALAFATRALRRVGREVRDRWHALALRMGRDV